MRAPFLVVLTLSACNDGGVSKPKEDPAAGIRELARKGPWVQTTPDDISREYGDNPVAADEKYKRKGVYMTGPVSAIVVGSDGVPNVFLGPDSNHNRVGCSGADHDDVAALHIGETISVTGAGAGMVEGLPMLVFCTVGH
jgi:hypothetical protein